MKVCNSSSLSHQGPARKSKLIEQGVTIFTTFTMFNNLNAEKISGFHNIKRNLLLKPQLHDFKGIGDLLENMQSFKIPKSMTLVSLQCHNNNRIICNSLVLRRKGYDSYISYRPRPLLALKPSYFIVSGECKTTNCLQLL